jgi:hypothetical protein
MAAKTIFQIDMALGYVAWALCVARYVWPRLRGMDRVEALRAIATLHSFRFFGLVFLLPGFVGPALPGAFATPTAYGDFATALLALSVLLTARMPVLFWPLVWAFNLVGAADLVMATANAIRVDLPSIAGQLGAAYAIPILFVPLLLITHGVAFYLLLRPAQAPARRLRRARGGLWGRRDREAEGAPGADDAFDPDSAAMRFNEPLGDVEAQP